MLACLTEKTYKQMCLKRNRKKKKTEKLREKNILKKRKEKYRIASPRTSANMSMPMLASLGLDPTSAGEVRPVRLLRVSISEGLTQANS